MRTIIASVVGAVLLGGFTVATAQLPPEIIADSYLLQAEQAVRDGDHARAQAAINKIIELQNEHELDLPDGFHFKYAQVAFSAGLNEAAIDSVNEYLATAGEESEFQRDALELLDKAKQELLDEANQGLPEMVEIPAGRFRMGCVSGKSRDGDEKPVYEVRIRPFMLSKDEVTFEEYDYFTNETGYTSARQAWGRGQLPVINIAWCGEDYSGGTHPVGQKAPNTWGLPDMLGNVAEWVQDCWNDDYEKAPTDGSAWEGENCNPVYRVVRGGSWSSDPESVRSAGRGGGNIGQSLYYGGFRVARPLTP